MTASAIGLSHIARDATSTASATSSGRVSPTSIRPRSTGSVTR